MLKVIKERLIETFEKKTVVRKRRYDSKAGDGSGKLMGNTVQQDKLCCQLNQLTFFVRPAALLIQCGHFWRRIDGPHPKNRRERHDCIVGHV